MPSSGRTFSSRRSVGDGAAPSPSLHGIGRLPNDSAFRRLEPRPASAFHERLVKRTVAGTEFETMRVVPTSILRAKARAKTLASLLAERGRREFTLTQSQAILAAMLGFASWAELSTVTERGPADPVDEDLPFVALVERRLAQAGALARHADIDEAIARLLVAQLRPTGNPGLKIDPEALPALDDIDEIQKLLADPGYRGGSVEILRIGLNAVSGIEMRATQNARIDKWLDALQSYARGRLGEIEMMGFTRSVADYADAYGFRSAQSFDILEIAHWMGVVVRQIGAVSTVDGSTDWLDCRTLGIPFDVRSWSDLVDGTEKGILVFGGYAGTGKTMAALGTLALQAIRSGLGGGARPVLWWDDGRPVDEIPAGALIRIGHGSDLDWNRAADIAERALVFVEAQIPNPPRFMKGVDKAADRGTAERIASSIVACTMHHRITEGGWRPTLEFDSMEVGPEEVAVGRGHRSTIATLVDERSGQIEHLADIVRRLRPSAEIQRVACAGREFTAACIDPSIPTWSVQPAVRVAAGDYYAQVWDREQALAGTGFADEPQPAPKPA